MQIKKEILVNAAAGAVSAVAADNDDYDIIDK